MIDVLDWVKKRAGGQTAPKAAAAPADGLLPDLGGSEPIIALNELTSWLEPGGGASTADRTARGDILARIQDAGSAHVAALLAQYLTGAAGKPAARESTWKSLVNFEARLTHGLGLSAKALLSAAYEDASLLTRAEASTVRALHSCRTLAKICLVHYASVPASLWRMAYELHASAEEIGSASAPVKADADQKTATTVEQEFLRLLMLQVSAPDMMAPEQIEIADRVLDQVGEQLTLRPVGVADNPFCFDAQSDSPPRRKADGQAGSSTDARYFGPGLALDALERMHRQLAGARIDDIKIFGEDIAPRAQLGTVQHLIAFWGEKNPYVPPARSPADGKLQLTHRYAQIWKQISDAQQGAGELALVDEGEETPQAPENWTLCEVGGDELGAELAQPEDGHGKCGAVVAVAASGESKRLVGMIRRMHWEPGGRLRVDIAVLSRDPRTLSLREVHEKGEDSAVSDAASRQFAFGSVRAVILADGAQGSAPPNVLLPAESWKGGRVYETMEDPPRYLRALQAIRYGDDYVRARFEWVDGPG